MRRNRLVPLAAYHGYIMRSMMATILALFNVVAWAEEPAEEEAAPPPVPDQATLEKEFAETMSGATLVGSYTEIQAGEEASDEAPALHQEKYSLGKVKKLKEDVWLIEMRVPRGDRTVTLPLALDVKWAGDTPVITLTEMEVPNMGKFTARVMVFRGHYSGMWSGGDRGGQLFGRVVPAGQEPPQEGGGKDRN